MAQINQFRVVSNGVSLDTYDNLDFSFTYQIEDIEDITSIKESFSKTILLPGTKLNQEYFKQIQDVDIDISNTSYNPKKSLPVEVLVGDELIFKGNLQLLSIVQNQNQTDFEVVVTGVFKNIIISLSDYYINQLNIDEYNHNRNVATILNSYDNNIYVNGTLTQVSQGTGYIYPTILNGTFQPQWVYNSSGNGGVAFNSYDLNPAIYLKTIMDKLFQFAGYTYTSKFFNTDYFKALIIPLERPQYTSEEYNNLTTRVGIVDTTGMYYPTFGWFPITYYPQLQGAYTALALNGFRALSPGLDNNSNTNPIWCNCNGGKYWFPFDKETGNYGNITFQDNNNQWNQNYNNTLTKSMYKNITPGMYSITLKAAFQALYVEKTNRKFKYKQGLLKYWVDLMKKDAITGSLSIIVGSNQQGTSFSPSDTTTMHNGRYLDAVPISMDLNATNVYLNANDEVFIRVRFQYPTSVQWTSPLFPFPYSPKVIFQGIIPYQNTQVNYLEIKPSSNYMYSINSPLPLSSMLPPIKMRDLLLDVCKMFNLMVYDNPNIANDLIIEPKDDFFNSKMKVKDWTYKLDYNQDITQTPMSELDVKSYYFTYKEDKDYYNEQFTETTGKVYGEQRVDFVNDFSVQEKKLELFTSPTITTTNFIPTSQLIVPVFADVSSTNQLSPLKVNTRILFSKKISKQSINVNMREYPGQPYTLVKNYVYCGMYDNPTNPTYTLEFGNSGILYYDTPLCCPTNNLINQFYLTTLNELTDVNSKLLEGYFHLTPSDIKDFDFRDIILINNSYWRVNRIEDYNPNAIDKTTKVILYKLNYIDVAYNDNLEVSESEVDCPDDMIAKPAKYGGYIYVSLSNQPITEACCDNIGGFWVNGVCKAPSGTPNTPSPAVGSTNVNNPNGKLIGQNQIKSGGIYQERPDALLKNQTVNNSTSVIILGDNNFTDETSSNSIIIGNNNAIKDGITNSIIVGDGITNAPSNSIVVGDLLIDTDGIRWLNTYITDGGKDEVMQVNKTNLIDIIDASQDSVRTFGGDSKERPIIDGTEI